MTSLCPPALPQSAAELPAGAAKPGVYLHIPFCRAKCRYCDFYSAPAPEAELDVYTAALLRALEEAPEGFFGADTLYFGGGTPSLLGGERLSRLLKAARARFACPETAEITVELNPESTTPALLFALREAGANRLSVGVQSFCESELSTLGRLHSARRAEETLLAARAAGFQNVSADLMLAFPSQTLESALESARRLAALPVTHISAYLLSLEEGTPLARDFPGYLHPEAEAIYRSVGETLADAGFARYEISNYARAGFESRHNLKYWNLADYLGLGPAAHSLYRSRRRHFPPDRAAFCVQTRPFSLWCDDGPGGGFEEYAMLRLRLAAGVRRELLPEAWLPEAEALFARAAPYEKRGLLRLSSDAVSLTTEGFLYSTPLIAALLG